MTENNLLPCPFCGGEAELCVHETTRVSWVRCTECEVSNGATSSKAAVQSWNRRAAVTDYDFPMAVHDGELWGKCSECERVNDAEMEAAVQWGEAAYANDAVRQRDALIRDLYRMVNCACLTDELKCIDCKLVGEGIPCDLTKMHRRICDLGIEVD